MHSEYGVSWWASTSYSATRWLTSAAEWLMSVLRDKIPPTCSLSLVNRARMNPAAMLLSRECLSVSFFTNLAATKFQWSVALEVCNTSIHYTAQCIVIGPVCGCVAVFVCGSVTTITQNCVHGASILTKLGLWVTVVTISSWLNFVRPAPTGRGSAAGQNFWLRLTTASVQCLHLPRALFLIQFALIWLIIPSVLWHYWLGDRQGIHAYKNLHTCSPQLGFFFRWLWDSMGLTWSGFKQNWPIKYKPK